jgi:hypothetical protein
MALVRRELLQITTPPRKAALEGFTPCPGDDAFYVGARDAPHVFPHDALCGAHASPVSPPPPPRSLVLQLASPPQFRRVSRPSGQELSPRLRLLIVHCYLHLLLRHPRRNVRVRPSAPGRQCVLRFCVVCVAHLHTPQLQRSCEPDLELAPMNSSLTATSFTTGTQHLARDLSTRSEIRNIAVSI